MSEGRQKRNQPCPDCGSWQFYCPCNKRETRLDSLAAEWVKQHGEHLDHPLRQTGLCGDSKPDLNQRRSVFEGQLNTLRLREYRELARLRIEQIDKTSHALKDERFALSEDIALIDALYDGDGKGVKQITKEAGYSSHSWGSKRVKRLSMRVDVFATEGAGYVGRYCKYPRCAKPLTRERAGEWVGRAPEYCDSTCKNRHNHGILTMRRRMRIALIRRQSHA